MYPFIFFLLRTLHGANVGFLHLNGCLLAEELREGCAGHPGASVGSENGKVRVKVKSVGWKRDEEAIKYKKRLHICC